MAMLMAILGVVVGLFFPQLALSLEFIGSIFLLLLKMLIIPIVVTSLFLSIAKLNSMELKKLGKNTLIFYLLTSTLACLSGIIIANMISLPEVFDPNKLISHDPSKLENLSFKTLVTSFFSDNFFKALSDGNIVQIIVFTLLISFAFLKIKNNSYRESLLNLFEAFHQLITIIIGWVLKFAPLGVFALLAALFAKHSVSVFTGLSPLFYAILASLLIHTLITLPGVVFLIAKINPYKFIFKCRKALIVAFTTASSTATLPISTQVLVEQNEVSQKTAGFTLPLGATLNMDGSALYQALVVLFFGQMSGMDLTLYQELLVFLFVMLSSAGTAGIPGGGLVMMTMILEMIGIPLEYVGLYILIDRIWDYPVTMVNVMGDLYGAKVIERLVR